MKPFGPEFELHVDERSAELEKALWLHSLAGEDLPASATAPLIRGIDQRFFAEGEFLYRRGERPQELFFVFKGRVAHVLDAVRLRTFGPRDALGVIDAIIDRSHVFDAQACEDTVALVLGQEDFLEFLEDQFETTRRIILRMASDLPPTSPPRPDLTKPTAHRRLRRRDLLRAENHRASLGPSLRLSAAERLAVLRACPALSSASVQALARLAHLSQTLELSSGEVMHFKEHGFYVVETGRVRAITQALDGVHWVEESSAGGAIGGMGWLEGARFKTQLEGLEDSTIFYLSTEALFDVMEDHFTLARSVLAHLASETETVALSRESPSSTQGLSWDSAPPVTLA